MKSRIVDGARLTAAEIAAWRDLALACVPDGNAFISPTFTQAASQAWPGRVKACLIDSGSDAIAVLPYQFPSGFAAALGAAVRVGEEMSDYFGVIAAPDLRCATDELLGLAGLSHLYFTHLEERQTGRGLAGEKAAGGLRILLPDGGPAYLDALARSDAKFSKDTERRLRKAVQDLGEARFCLDEPDPATWLSRVLAEKRAQYLRTKNVDWLADPGRRKLMEILADGREPDCRPVVSTLMFGDKWAAIHFGLRSHRTLHYWFPVYNPDLGSYAPGRLLLYHVIREAQTAGIAIIDRGEGETQAKKDFPSERHTFYSGVWFRPGVRALIYRAYQSAAWRLAEATRK